MSLMPFSSRSSSRSSGGGDAGGEKKLSNRKYTISLSFSGLITSGIITIIAIGWIFAFGVIVGRGYNPEKKMPELARLLPPPEGQDAPKEAKGILKPEELTFMTDLKQTQPAANAAPNKPEAKAAHPTAQPGGRCDAQTGSRFCGQGQIRLRLSGCGVQEQRQCRQTARTHGRRRVAHSYDH